jgi:hypothetical protein
MGISTGAKKTAWLAGLMILTYGPMIGSITCPKPGGEIANKENTTPTRQLLAMLLKRNVLIKRRG